MDAEEMARNTTKVILGAANSADEETVAHIKQALARVPEGSMVSVPSEWPGDRYDDLIAASYGDDDAPKPEKPKEKNVSGKAPESEMKNDPIAKAEALLAKATIVETKMEEMSIEEKAMWWDSFYMEGKARHVRDAAFWGAPVGTLITPGMKPQGTGASRGSSRSSGGGSVSKPASRAPASTSRRPAFTERSASPKKPTTSTSGFDPVTQSMLSPADQKMPPANQISKLRRVAVRADKHAQWLEELIRRGSNRDNAKNRQAIEESYDRAKAATNEMLHVAKQANDPRLTNSVRAQRPLRVKKPGGKTYPRR